MTNTLKTLLTLAAVLSLLAGCTNTSSSSDNDDNVVATPEPTMEPVIEVDPYEALEGLSTVFYFDFDQSILKAEARAALMIYAEVLGDAPKSIRLEGHADERGTREYNMALGEQRANAVRDFLVLQGVDASIIETVSYGEESPVALGGSEGSWSQNRRVQIKL
ncbi:OmpA family protein [Teredinibacter purpureus]|uniref:OmpA family protein n=1 Tax=Teredinibacter purpureus TaxID=2731756 RepID=UPI0005F7EB89|nr:OmpA family protein [Teredinibacter purpureus]